MTDEAKTAEADLDGVFPEGFYATTSFPTEVRIGGAWLRASAIEMDVGIRVLGTSVEGCPMHAVKRGDRIVVGEAGVRVLPPPSSVPTPGPTTPDTAFSFMSSSISTERPKARLIAEAAAAIRAAKAAKKKVLFVGGPAIVHGASGPALEALLDRGFIDVLFAGNALAAHDIESAMFGTSLGIDLAAGAGVPHGHQHHLRAINRVRRAGSIANAVAAGLVTRGIMHTCVKKQIPFVLAGSIRDDGPLPDVITDVVAAADAMRAHARDASVAIIVATTLHGIATGNMLPAEVATFCVDSSADTVIKLVDRGTRQAVGIVTDCAYFLSELLRVL